jgi:dTDP-4-dehydrorhamnose 3,5-epimerase-like enzyme
MENKNNETYNSSDNALPKDVVISLDVEYEDERGSIIPLADIPMKSCVLITSKKNTVRANHYHKTDWHFCYVMEGSIDYFHRPCGDLKEPELVKIKKGQLFFTPPMVEHAMVFTEDTTFLTLGRNSREQKVYEEDIERVILINPQTLKHDAL